MRHWTNTSGNVTRLHSRCTSSPVRWRHLHRPNLKCSNSSGHLERTKNKRIDSSASSRKLFPCPSFSHLRTCGRFSVIEAPACDATVVYLAPCAFLDCAQVTGNPGVISSPVGLVPTNALVLTEPINSETIVREHLVAWSVAGGSGLKCPTPQKRGSRIATCKAVGNDCLTRRT